MIECPKCFNQFNGAKCGCGYVPRNTAPINATQFQERMAREREFQAECARWLLHNRVITAQMSKPEKMKAMAVYRARLLKARPIAETEPRAWAYEILSKIADGEIVSPVQEQMAREVTGIWREERDAA